MGVGYLNCFFDPDFYLVGLLGIMGRATVHAVC